VPERSGGLRRLRGRRRCPDPDDDGERLRAIRHGEDCPPEPAHTAEACEKNRRVEIEAVRAKDGPSGVGLAGRAVTAARRPGRLGRMLHRVATLSAAALALAASACVNTDPAVFVEASVTGPSAKITPSSVAGLGATLDGGFVLSLHLGARASGPSKVSLQSFSLTNADQTTTIVPTLPVAFSDSSQHDPVDVEPDTTVSVPLSFTSGNQLISAQEQTAICKAGGLRIVGAIQDSLQAGATPLTSQVFQPTGCP
jgi:hypothetical protein